ncbi:TatD family hydrolase [Patescibacteria group bacterium]|nr:TatD family hydrolase [Patescibacteria group bacterium]MBU4353225.1 TatD family hydrolase [Patescibacteria group bacterium]MBU4477121.1 TatD family hydrolase [Patescibacteria group bacterium]MCG2698950.1 TatD family hydrolase [Candidatus Parcubacteria bacterium]
MIPKYFDIHSHLNFADFDKDREEVIKRMLAHGIWTIIVGVDFESSKKAVEIAGKYEGMFASVGLHPTDAENLEIQFPSGNWISKLRKLTQHPKVMAIGECGIDIFRREKDYLARQKDILKQQIELAIELDKPLMIHCRDAHKDVLEILNLHKCQKLRGDIHFFSGSLEQAEKYFELGFLISFTGVITFARDYDEIIRNAPLDKIMIETDAPFVAPITYRGQRNEPSYVIEVAKKIAEIKGISEEEAAKVTTANALNLFRI